MYRYNKIHCYLAVFDVFIETGFTRFLQSEVFNLLKMLWYLKV